MNQKKQPPLHPSKILKTKFLNHKYCDLDKIADSLSVNRMYFKMFMECRIGITADLAYKLGLKYSTSREYWLALQTKFDNG